ncbi:DUF6318 family protein [Actinomyces respiraculi]|uniref:DUF6318 domain-containing protein n=2 Tax=Actinomyces TaxID=1654 RepID=A0A7T0LKH0_9ACTO|nr:DUF6318 family protein [Actinomyces respiraculi]QPL05096.1 hypothetical protein ID810_10195 [Actinomyces respiraculi]
MSLRFLRPDPHGRADEPGLAGVADSCGLVGGVRGGQADDVEAVAQARRAWRRFLVLMVVLVVVCAAAGAGAARWWSSHRPRDPYPWETSVASSYRPPTTTPTPELTPEPTPTSTSSLSSLLSAEEQALREAALATPAPERPATIDQFTPEGAIAAAEYYLSLLRYVYATGDLSAWQAMSDPHCIFCTSVTDYAIELHDAGGWTDPWEQEVTPTTYGAADTDLNIWLITLHATHPETVEHDGSGGTSTLAAEDITFVLQLRWDGKTWIVEAGEIR